MLCLGLRPASGSELRLVESQVPRVVRSLAPVGSLAPDRRLELALGLPLRHREELTSLIAQLYDPGSPLYRHYLTPQQFAERFGPSQTDYQALIDFAQAHGFVLRRTHPNRLLLDVNATAAEVEQAFHLKLKTYRHPTEPRFFYAPDREPSVDSAVPVLSIAGLDDFSAPRPMDLKIRLTNSSPRPQFLDATGSGPSGTFLGADFRAAYAPGLSLDGSGEAIGLVEFDSYYPNDIAQYEQLAGLAAVPLTNVLVKGFNRAPGSNNGEVALDIEMAVSMAPGLAKVIVYEGTLANDILNQMATDNQARQLSCSWSFGPVVDATREQIFEQFAAQGQSFFQSSGDAGAYGSGSQSPSDDRLVTAVGGTALTTTGPGGSWLSESAWSGGGGGVSTNYSIPVWQQPIDMAANAGSTRMRNVPDVAALADAAIWVIANNGEQGTASGTSASAPLWAGFTALVNQQAAAQGQPPVGFLNPALYAIGQSPSYSKALHDVTAGNNTNASSPTRFFAVPGYDLCTGWGTPTGSNLVNALLAPPDFLSLGPSTSFLVTGPVGGPFSPAPPAFSLTNTGPIPLSWAVGSTASWLSLSPTTGGLAPGGRATALQPVLEQAATNLAAGSYVADLWFTNLTDGFVQRRQLTLQIVMPPLLISQPASLSLPAGATARFLVQAATNTFPAFQWQAHGTNLLEGGRVSGSATSGLTLSNISGLDAGTYSVLLSNAAGVFTSANASLTVTSSAPIIALQPSGQTVLPAASATFSVGALGDPPLGFQWRANGTNLRDGGNIAGSTSSQLTIRNVSAADAGSYAVVVSNSLGTQASSEAPLAVVSLTTPGLVQSVIHGFTGGLEGAQPNSLALGRDGQVYGTTQAGGENNSGTVFQMDSGGQLSSIYSFTGTADGARPNGGLVQYPDFTLFGSTYGGGTNAFGTLFKLTTNGILTTLFTLDHTNGVLPAAGLTPGTDGKLYGTAYEGGIYHYGTLFRLDTNGNFSTILPFGGTNGAFPHSDLLQGTDGNFYGTTYKGGAPGYGTVFKVSPAGALTPLASFDGTNGAFPLAGLTEPGDGNFYGCSTHGGVFGSGNLFRISRTGALTNLVSFTGLADGSHPSADLMLADDGNLYGTTSDGGAFNAGTVFRLSPQGTLTTMAVFDGYNGAHPQAPLLQGADGNLYGVTPNGGPDDQGVVFRLGVPASPPQITSPPAAVVAYAGSTIILAVAGFGSPPLLYQWQKDGTNLANSARLLGAQARLLTIINLAPADAGSYSVTIRNGLGSVASSAAAVQVLTSAPFFVIQPTNQTVSPGATVVLSSAVQGNQPLLYQWQVGGTNLQDTGNVSGSTTDTLVITNATQANNGRYMLSVTNALGGATSAVATVTVVPLTAPGTTLNTLYAFGGGQDGARPSQLTDGLDGYLYGTTPYGGAFADGTLFRIGAQGGFTPLLWFNQTNGALPQAGLARSADGSLYGSTSAGGLFGAGTLFVCTPAGALTTVNAFTGNADGGSPAQALIQGFDGSFYGSTEQGGAAGLGTIFQLNPGNSISTLHSFTGRPDGSSVNGALLQLPDGGLYGVTGDGGSFTNGSVFKISPTREFTTIYSFSGGTDGYLPVGSLVLGDDGYLYGATRYNTIRGFAFYGTLFKLSTNGAFTTLYALNFSDGSYPAAGLVLGADGNFYGTTQQGGANDEGTLFRMTPGGVVSTLVEFDGFDDGSAPMTALTATADGSIYGTTSSGGPGGRGTLFRLSFTGAPQLTAQPLSQPAYTGSAARFSVAVTGGWPLAFQWQRNGTNLIAGANVVGSNERVLTLTGISLADAGKYSVVVSNSAGLVASAGATLTIEVAPPSLQAKVQADGTLLLAWNTAPGRHYQVQSNATLATAGWVNLGSPMTASGSSLSASVLPGPGSRQFYRVVLLP